MERVGPRVLFECDGTPTFLQEQATIVSDTRNNKADCSSKCTHNVSHRDLATKVISSPGCLVGSGYDHVRAAAAKVAI